MNSELYIEHKEYDLVSVYFTVFRELTLNRHQTVGRFYNSDFGSIPLTTVIGLRARVNPVGMGIAFIRISDFVTPS